MWVLSVVGVLAVAVGIFGFFVMAHANSPTNRHGNQLAEIGVFFGGMIGVAGVLLAAGFALTIANKYRSARRR
jgi:hypothetical protein